MFDAQACATATSGLVLTRTLFILYISIVNVTGGRSCSLFLFYQVLFQMEYRQLTGAHRPGHRGRDSRDPQLIMVATCPLSVSNSSTPLHGSKKLACMRCCLIELISFVLHSNALDLGSQHKRQKKKKQEGTEGQR